MKTIGTSETDALSASGAPDAGARVLVVGDDGSSGNLLATLLSENGFSCTVAADASEARVFLTADEYAVVLADMDMPGLSGLNLVMEVANSYPDSAVVMLTGLNDPTLLTSALDVGAYGYMVKPLQPVEVLININNALRRRSLEMDNRKHCEELEGLIRSRTDDLRDAVGRLQRFEKELLSSREETIERLSIAAEFRDNETIKHIKRVSGYCGIIARASGHDQEHCEMIRIASQLHDVGKIAMPDQLLTKEGPLTEEERELMKQHTEIGYRILAGSHSEVLTIAASIALTHHERFDGAGYPRGLSGESIPLEGRMLAVADVFDGLTSDRVYKKAVSIEEAISVMQAESDKQLDADLVDLFLSSMHLVLPIKDQFKDG